MEGTRLFGSGSVHSSQWAPFDCQQGSLAAPGGAGGGQEGKGLGLQQAVGALLGKVFLHALGGYSQGHYL